jgi:hypothetical protein
MLFVRVNLKFTPQLWLTLGIPWVSSLGYYTFP